MPGPHRVSARRLRQAPLDVLRELSATGERTVRFRLGRQEVLLLLDPDLITEVLTRLHRDTAKDNVIWSGLRRGVRPRSGPSQMSSLDHGEHLSVRRLVQPAFGTGRLEAHEQVLEREVRRVVGSWQGEVEDVYAQMLILAASVMGEVALGYPFGKRISEITGGVDSLLQSVRSPVSSLGLMLAGYKTEVRAAETRDGLVAFMAEALRSQRLTDGGALSLLAASDGPPERLAEDATVLLLAGVDTSAAALTWLAYLLSRHPRVREQLLSGEVEPLWCALETVRLYPSAWYTGRRPLRPLDVGGEQVEAHSLILISPVLTQRDARFFDAPDEFRPERWREPRWPRHAFFPFGAGGRKCLGERLSLAELTVMASALAPLRLEPADDLEMHFGTSLVPAGPLTLRLG
jgi:cytochrome P450